MFHVKHYDINRGVERIFTLNYGREPDELLETRSTIDRRILLNLLFHETYHNCYLFSPKNYMLS